MGYYNIHKEGSEGIETGRDAFEKRGTGDIQPACDIRAVWLPQI